MREDDFTERLLGILSGVLPDRGITLDVHLRDLGIESLALTRVWFLLRQEFAVDIPVSWLRVCPTPADLLVRIRAETGGAAAPSIPCEPEARHKPFPLTDLQQAYLVAKDSSPGGDPIGCHVYREFEVQDLDVTALKDAWRRVIQHHDMLRAVITPDGRQQVSEHVPTPTIAVGALDGAEAVRARLAHRRYAAGEWPMHTVEVSHAPGGRSIVHLSIDVLLIDGHGLGVILDDWSRCYRDPDHELVRPALSVRDCVQALIAQQRTPQYQRDLDYWIGRLAHLPAGPDLTGAGAPRDRPHRTGLTGRLDHDHWQALGRLAGLWGVSPTALVLTVFAEAFGWQRTSRPLSLILTSSHRARLPREADDLVGPFTSSLIVSLPDTLDRPLRDAVTEVHDRLWQALDHAGVSGVSALRALRALNRTAPVPSLPVVFTSLLGTGRNGADGFASSVTYALSQTTGIALDHQMWEHDGELHVRWDVVADRFGPGETADLFAVFLNGLRSLGDGPVTGHGLNALQQAYFVPRAMNGQEPWNGCQVYHSFTVEDLDLDRLEGAWLRLVGAYDALRTVVTQDGRLAISTQVPTAHQIPVIQLAGLTDPEAYRRDLCERMVGRAFPLGRGPQSDLRVTIDAVGVAEVHLTTDLTILDGRSIHFLVRELFRLYDDPHAVPAPAASHGDYLSAQSVLQESADRQVWIDHWGARVAALHRGPSVLPSGGQRQRRRFEGRLSGWRAVRKRAHDAGLTPDSVLAAALTAVLAQDHPVPFSLPFVRWTPSTAKYRPGEYTALSWVSLEDDALGLWEQASRYQRILDEDCAADAVSGLGELRRRVMRERRAGDFDLPVVYTSILDLSGQQLPNGVRLGPWLTCTPDVALDCIAIDEGDELRFYWDTTPSQFPPGQLPAMFERYRALLEGLHATTVATDEPAITDPVDRPVHLRFVEQAAARPDAVALRWTNGTMTFAELNRWANRIAWALRERGVAPGTAVGISVRRGPEMVAAVYGVLKAGGTYVPLEPTLPVARAVAILADAQIGLVLTNTHRTGWNVPDTVDCVAVESPGQPETNPESIGTIDDTAYVIFTSGSTGKPKGVAVGHRPLLNLFDWCVRTHGFGPSDVGLCVTSLGFDLSVFDILGLLGCGGSLYLADDDEQRDPHLLLDVLLREPITFWNSAPTTLNQLAPLFPSRAGHSGASTLRLVYLSGDYTPLPLPDEVRRLFSGARIVSLGGATEATVWSNWFEVGAIDPSWRTIPYGRPIDNARYYILDDDLRPCPVGVEGGLYIGGECLSFGYYRQPELTAQRFIADPFADRPGALMYDTGDRASFFPDGVICFLGRADSQVKIRGFRVELAEVEHALRCHDQVKDVVALAQDGAGDRKLVAYVVPAAAVPSVAELRQHAAETLPEYMVPNVVVFVDTFPATPNGKLDRAALPWPVEPGSSHTLTSAAPTDLLETRSDARALAEEIASIFAELLGLPAVEIGEDIWDQGATSFTMVQVSGVLQQRHGWRVPVSVLLGDPTVAGIASALSALSDAPPTDAPVTSAPMSTSALPIAAATTGDTVEFFSAVERDAFKAARRDLRHPVAGVPTIVLPDAPVAEEHFTWRASRREFAPGPVSYVDFARLLGLLRETEIDGRRRRLYPSAGDTYSVQVYLHVRPDGVEGIPAGLYYYHPVEHALHVIAAHPALDRSMHFVYNRPIYDHAGFEVYLFGQNDAVEPLYGADSERFQLLEAGYLGQLLMLGQASCAVGLCPVGTLALDAVRVQLGLTDRHTYLHAFLGGPIAAPWQTAMATGERPLFVSSVQPAGTTADVPEVVVVGAAGRFPGADGLEAYWQNLSNGTRSLVPVPQQRRRQFPADAPPGGYLSDVDSFDSLFFRVAPAEAAMLDPQLRLLLHTVWECLDSAGHTAASLGGSGRVGVFCGAMWQDYQHVAADHARAGNPAVISATASEAANRISHFFNFDGPSMAIDTSCSSSVAAVHLAVESLRRGECETAVVAAANLFTHPYHLQLLSDVGLLAQQTPGGAFDGENAGWSPGEGVAAILLRAKPSAERDGDTGLAVIEATRIGHLGGAGRFATPQAVQLARSMAATLAGAGLDPGDIDYVECAAAGATLADAAELEALGQVFAGRQLAVGTVKPNIGHLEAAAGLSQLVKVLLQLGHGQIAPTLLAPRSSTILSWPAGIRAADHLTVWPGAGPGRALINAVGATGSYGHVVLRSVESVRSAPTAEPPGRYAFPLSAQSDGRLADLAGALRRRLDTGLAPAPADIAYTLQCGRAHLERRAVIEASNLDELRSALDAVSAGQPLSARDAKLAAWQAGADIDWSAYRPAGGRRVALPNSPFVAEPYSLDARPGATSDPRATIITNDYLKGLYSDVSGIPVDRLDLHTPLENYGLSSYQVVQLNARLAAEFDADVPTTLFFAHRDLAGVAHELAGLSRPPTAAPALLPAPSVSGEPNDGRIAVIGMAGRYPQADDLGAFWQNLLAGRDLITDLPPDRRLHLRSEDLMIGGFLDSVAAFDPMFFGITPRDAASMDPQERLFLQTAWHALEDAGYTRTRLRERHGGRVGVFVGSMYNEYPFFGLDRIKPVGSAIAGIANRVSYFLDLNGPSMTVDTMCSSSLTALHLAVAALRRGECEAALVGGVNLSMHPNKFAQLRDLGMSSSDHRCRSFGVGGDGFVPGEGVGAMLLTPLHQAVTGGDRIHAVVLGTAVNHDGKTNGYTVPNPVAQGQLITEALRDAGVGADDIGYVEAHGTGTALGDPIEIDGLSRAFSATGRAAGSCAIGSLKSAIGHLEAAAGIAGLTKVILQFRHDTLAPSLHAEDLNPNIDWAHSPFRVQRDAVAWPSALPRRAGVSSFGAGGTNAHAIVEAYPRPAPVAVLPPGPQLVVISARTEEQLRLLVIRWLRMLRGDLQPSFADLAYTAQTGRESMRERLAVVAGDGAQLAAALERFLDGDLTHVRRGRIDAVGEKMPPPPLEASLNLLAEYWADGGTVDWSRLHRSPRRIVDLPMYPFDSVHCWVPAPDRVVTADTAPQIPLLAHTWQRAPLTAGGIEATGAVLCLTGSPLAGSHPGLAEAFAPAQLVPLQHGVDFTDAETAVTAVRAVLDRGSVTGVLDLCALSERGGRDEHDSGPWTARLAILQQVMAARPRSGLRILQVTSGLLGMPGPAPDLTGARMASFVRSLGAEYPWLHSTVLDTDRPDIAAELRAGWEDPGPYSEICRRDGVSYRPALVPASAGSVPWQPDPEKVYLITGGTRGIGALVARHLVRRGVRRLAILGGRPLPPRHMWTRGDLPGSEAEAVANLQELELLGARVMTYTGPLTRRAALTGFLADVRSALGPIGGLVHCAGRSTAGPAPFIRKAIPDIQQVLEPKTDGLDLLLELTRADSLQFAVLFSSVSAMAPTLAAGVSDYAAANAYLNLAAVHHGRTRLPGIRSVAWPVWAETGNGTDQPDAAGGVGLDALTDAAGLGVLDLVLDLPSSSVLLPCPARGDGFDADSFLRTGPAGEQTDRPPIRPELAADTAGGAPPPDWLVRIFAEALAIPVGELDSDVTFGDLGVESVLLAELVTRIEARIESPLEPVALLDHPTLRQLGAYLAGTGAAAERAIDAGTGSLDPAAGRSDDRIAVIGMACRFPGAPDLGAFWQLLRTGGFAVTEVPAGRWDTARLFRPERQAGYSVSKWGGFLEALEDFDPGFFGMSDTEARNMDPAIRLTLEASASCVSDAGYAQEELRGADIGVFMGARMSGYRRRIGLEDSATGLGGDQNFIAARVAHQYDLRGPALVVDSACSSALLALQTAVRSLLAGESVMALAGGVEVLLDEEAYLEFSVAGALSPRGRCATFDKDADGFVPGEGVGILLLKPLARALADGDRVHAVINSVAVGNDGHTMGLTTPNPAAQAQVIRRALALAGIGAQNVGLLEAHGTGTMIGDPIELRALRDVYREHTDRTGFCAIGSVKSNLGHLLSAAGIAGLIKVLLSVEHAEIPPTLFCDTPNPRFDFATSPFVPSSRLRQWPGQRVGGVSAFGLGGTNAHAVVSAGPDARPRRTALSPPMFHRRRLWWDRSELDASATDPGQGEPLVTSVLDLEFRTVGETERL